MSELRERLFAAPTEALAELGERHRDAIVAEFRDWLVVPQPLREDSAATQSYVGAILRIAKQLAVAGEPRPLDWLTGDDHDNNQLARWQAQLANGQGLAMAGHPNAAAVVLHGLLDSLDQAGGPLVDDLATRAQGALSSALLDLGDNGGARAYARAALDNCIAAHDLDGIRTYMENLDLLDALVAGPELEALREGLAEAQDLSDAGRYDAANELLQELAGHNDVDRYAGKLCGLVGLNLFRLGDPVGARDWTEAAVRACDAADDPYGATIYGENLRVIDRATESPTASGLGDTYQADGSAPFVISLEGQIYSDPTGSATDRELSGDATEVLAAGRWVVQEGRALVITNESPAYHPSLAQMKAALEHLDAAGIDLTGDDSGVLVIVYDELDKRGQGKRGKKYRAKKNALSIELVPHD